MNVVLINPYFHYSTPWIQVSEPLGLLYLASYVRKYSNHKVTLIDCLQNKSVRKIKKDYFLYGLSNEELIAEIKQKVPDVDIIGISCMFSRKKQDFLTCASVLKKAFPQAKLVAGGTYPSLFPREIIENDTFNFCIIGEAEESFTLLLYKIEKKDDIKGFS
jgi:radical SAM superfamily enzyme YgiQ (UPF0313 family)